MEEKNDTGFRNSEQDKKQRKRYDQIVVPVIEETFHVEKETVEKSKVKLHKEVFEEIVNLNIPLQEENIQIDRIPKNEYVDIAPPAIRQEGDTTVISVLKEVVEKRTILVEEVRVKKEISRTESEVQEKIRNENVKVEREAIRPKHNSDSLEGNEFTK